MSARLSGRPDGTREADFLLVEPQRGVEGAGAGVVGTGVQGEILQLVLAGPGLGGLDEGAAESAAGRGSGHRQLADVAVLLTSEMRGRVDADHADEVTLLDRDEDGPGSGEGVVERAVEPFPPGVTGRSLVAPGGDALGQPGREPEDRGTVGGDGRANGDGSCAHGSSLPPVSAKGNHGTGSDPRWRRQALPPRSGRAGSGSTADRGRTPPCRRTNGPAGWTAAGGPVRVRSGAVTARGGTAWRADG